ncbi:MAG: GH3 auxin-responsive promoter family protein [Mariprofundaceae bacterium]|nr:GH3 auxin-responsive promoter family protein [Mariprofundaceae bacterium]
MLHKLKKDYKLFLNALENPQEAQLAQLHRILNKNKDSSFGKQYHFNQLKTIEDYQTSLPIQHYESFAESIQKMQQGHASILFSEPATIFENTGGSSGGQKIIPWNNSAFEALRRGIKPWLADLLTHHPDLLSGSSYWAISPVGKNSSSSHDVMFFGAEIAEVLIPRLAVPLQISSIEDMDAWAYWTLRYLIVAKDLRFISVWSPTFMLQVIRKLLDHAEQVIYDIRTGTSSFSIPDWLHQQHPMLQADPLRAKELYNTIQCGNFQMLWSELKVISCWKDASSSFFIDELTAYFPNVYIQGKGLIATEGITSLPLFTFPYPVLSIHSAFYEFIDQYGDIYLGHELLENEQYRIVITNHAGLYRYDTGDMVCIRGYAQNTPMLQFMGRVQCSDICGEKINEGFAHRCLKNLRGFVMLTPSIPASSNFHNIPHYILLLDKNNYSHIQARQTAVYIDQQLSKNPQYLYAKKIGQLACVQVIRVENFLSRYIAYRIQQGHNLGDIKPPCLYLSGDWQLWALGEQ